MYENTGVSVGQKPDPLAGSATIVKSPSMERADILDASEYLGPSACL